MGNSFPSALRFDSETVHPHVHGELKKALKSKARYTGSSPRAWGTLSNFYMEHGRLLPGYPDGGSIRPVIIGNKRHDRPALWKTI